MFDNNQPNYQSLRNLVTERTTPIVFWVGAGLSAAARLPIWNELKVKLMEQFRSHFNSMDDSSKFEMFQRLDLIKKEEDLWLSFERLHDLGKETYKEGIRQAFRDSDYCQIPENYKRLFRLDAKGIITLNIDRLVSRAFSNAHPGKKSVEFAGNKCGDFAHVLSGPNPFILNAHGIVDDASSWVFRHSQLKWLFCDEAYRQFIQAVLLSHTVVFVGISVNDVAIQTHFDRLKEAGIFFRGHYWITDRCDQNTNDWAEENEILLIRYTPDERHSALGEMLDDLSRFQSSDPNCIPPVTSDFVSSNLEELPPPEELSQEPVDDVRLKLNKHAKYLLSEENSVGYSKYEEFRRRYDKCIHDCWYVDILPPHNTLMGYELVKEIAEGAFGRVFEATSPSGQTVALKLLKEEARRKPSMLQSFRRGVRAMRILSKHDVQGMVGYTDCSEIPAFAVMDFISGPNLKDAVNYKYLDDWGDLLWHSIELTSVIRRAHQLPERVLHRDIRPANIMLKDYFTNPDESHIVVLDFDLSWHQDAQEVSIIQGPAMHGYLAPELTGQNSRASTRNAAVDSFGLGMTLFFMRTGIDPMYMQHRHTTWCEDVRRDVSLYSSSNWMSLPRRFADLILRCTKDNQSERCDVSQILGELQRLHDAYVDPKSVRASDLLCHELSYRAIGDVCWDYDRQEVLHRMSTGLSITLSSDESRHSVMGVLSWNNTGETEYRNVRKFLHSHADAASSILQKGGYQVTYHTADSTSAKIDFRSTCDRLTRDLPSMSECLKGALEKFRLQ